MGNNLKIPEGWEIESQPENNNIQQAGIPEGWQVESIPNNNIAGIPEGWEIESQPNPTQPNRLAKINQWRKNNIRPAHFIGDLGKSAYNGFREESILGANAITGAKNWALDKVGLSDWHRPTEEVKAEREALIPKAEVNPDAHVANFAGDILGWSPMFAVGGEAVQGIKLPKYASKVGNILGGSHNAGLDMAAFEGLRHELRQLGGEQDESTLAQNLLNGYGTGAAIGGAFGTLGAVAKPVIQAGLQSAPAQYIGRKVAPVLDKLGSTKFGSSLLSAIGEKAPEGTETRKMQELNAILSKDHNFTPEVEQMANQAEGLTKKQQYKLYHKLRHGEKVETPQEPANTPEVKLEEIKTKAKEKRLEKENVKNTDVTPEEYNSLAEQLRNAGHDDAQIEEILSSHGIKIKAEVNPEQKVEFIKDETPDNIEITSDTEEALKGRVKPETIEGIEITSDTPEKLTGRVNTEKGSPVKSEEGINTPKEVETPQNDQSVATQNENVVTKKLPENIKEIQQPTEGLEVTKLEPGKAEGSETSYRDLTRKKADTAQARREELNEALGEDNWYERDIDKEVWDEASSKNARFVSQDQGFNDWYSRYENAGINKRRAMIKSKFESFKTNEERQTFYDSFDKQMMRDKEIAELKSRQGDVTKPTITERDLATVLKHYKATGKLASGKKIKKAEEVNKIETEAEDFGLDILKAMGKGKNKPLAQSVADNAVGLSAFYRKEIIGEKATTAIKRARQRAKVEYEAALGNQRSKIALDKMYEQKLKTIENSGAGKDAIAIVKDELEKAYKKNVKKFEPSKSNLKSDLATRNLLNKEIDKYSSSTSADFNHRKQAAIDAFIDSTKELGASKNEADTSAIAKALQQSTDIRTGKHYIRSMQNVSNYFSAKNKSLLEQVRVITTNSLDHSNGEAAGRYNTILVKDGANIEKEILHEHQHIVDYQVEDKIRKLPDGDPLKDALETCENAYIEAKQKAADLYDIVNKNRKTLPDNDIYKIYNNEPTKENLTSFNLDNYKQIVNNVFGKNSKEALSEIEYAANREIYLKDVSERRSYNAENLVPNNEPFEDAIIRRANELKGTNNVRPNISRNKNNGGTTKPDLSRDGRSRENIFSNTKGTENTRNFETTSSRNETRKEQTPEQIKETLNPKATEVKAPSDFDNIYEGVKEISKQGEKVATDLRWITPEQAANRLKQQSKEGNGVYFKQGTNELTSGMDISLDYLEGRNSKEGLTGRKKIKGLVRKGSAKDIVVNTYKSTANRQHVADCLDFVEKNYAKPIPEDGKVPEGYVKVNRYALSFAQVNGLTREWLDAVMKGDKAIDANFGHLGEEGGYAKAVKDLRNYWTKDGEYSYMIPKSVRNYMLDEHGEVFTQYWDRYIKHNPAENGGIRGNKKRAFAKLAGEVNDFLLDRFKRGVLTSASFVLNNRMGNQMMIAAHSKNPIEYIQSFIEAGKLKDEKLPIELRENLISEAIGNSKMPRVRTGIKWFDTFADLCNGNYIDLKSTKSKSIELAPKSTDYVKLEGMTVPKGSKVKEHYTPKSLGALLANGGIALPNKIFNWFSDNLMAVNQACENFERKQAAYIQAKRLSKENAKAIPTMARQITAFPSLMDMAKDNPEFEQAIVKNVEDMLGNYRNFNKYEKGILKRLVPFYSWQRTMARHEAQLFKRNPVRWWMVHDQLAALREDNSDRKEYQQDAFATPIIDNGSRLLIGKGQQIPYNTWKENIENTKSLVSGKETGGENPLNGVSPVITIPAETVRGKKFFLDQDINDRKYARRPWDREYVNTETGDSIGDAIPYSARLNYLRKNLIDPTIYPSIKSPMVNTEWLGHGAWNLATKKKWDTPDKYYDTTYTGYKNGELYKNNSAKKQKAKNGKPEVPEGLSTRYAANDLSEEYKTANRLLGVTLQKERLEKGKTKPKAKLASERMREKTRKWRDKFRKK